MRLKMRGAAQMQETAMAVTEHPDNAVVIDPEEAGRLRAHKLERIGRWALPMLIMALAILAWDRICVWNEIPRYILPRPGEVVATLFQDSAILFAALGVTLKITFLSLGLAVLGGVGLSIPWPSRVRKPTRSSSMPSSATWCGIHAASAPTGARPRAAA